MDMDLGFGFGDLVRGSDNSLLLDRIHKLKDGSKNALDPNHNC